MPTKSYYSYLCLCAYCKLRVSSQHSFSNKVVFENQNQVGQIDCKCDGILHICHMRPDYVKKN